MNSFEAKRLGLHWDNTAIVKIIGWSLTAMFFLGIFAEFIVRARLIDWEDPGLTLTNIQDSLALFDAGILSFIAVIILDVLLSVSLYALFNSAGKFTAWIMVSLRLVYVAVKGFAIAGLFLARDMYASSVETNAGQAGVYAAQAMQFLKMHHYGFAVGLIFFGLHMISLALLLLRVNGIPKLFALMLLSAGIGYGMNSLVGLFAPGFALLKLAVIAVFIIPMTFSELSFGVWLWVRHKSAAPPLTA